MNYLKIIKTIDIFCDSFIVGCFVGDLIADAIETHNERKELIEQYEKDIAFQKRLKDIALDGAKEAFDNSFKLEEKLQKLEEENSELKKENKKLKEDCESCKWQKNTTPEVCEKPI